MSVKFLLTCGLIPEVLSSPNSPSIAVCDVIFGCLHALRNIFMVIVSCSSNKLPY